MREEQFIRFVEEICFLLKLSQPCSKTALQYFLQFKEYEGHHFDHEIMIATCIYLSTKIFEEEVRVRDILNIIYVLTTGYKLARHEQFELKQKKEIYDKQQEEKKEKEHNDELHRLEKENEQNKVKGDIIKDDNQKSIEMAEEKQEHVNDNLEQSKKEVEYSHANKKGEDEHYHEPENQHEKEPFILLKTIQKHPDLHDLIQPNYSLSDYNEYKSKIIEAEQTLLRILGFDFSLSEKNRTEMKQLLLTFHYMHMPATIAETILKVYNDVHYIDVGCWLEGLVYFGYLLVKNMVWEKEKEFNNNKIESENNEYSTKKQENDHKQVSEKELNEIKRINEFVNKMNTPEKWEIFLCTTIKELEIYAEKLANFYLAIEIS